MKRIVVLASVVTAFVVVGSSAQAANRHTVQVRSAGNAALLKQVTVAASEFKFVLSTKSAKRGIVSFKVTNVGAIPHNFSINGRTTKMLSHGQSDTLRVTFLRKGAYPYKCTVPGHAAAGMKGVFTIS